jgi:hypothetical protein
MEQLVCKHLSECLLLCNMTKSVVCNATPYATPWHKCNPLDATPATPKCNPWGLRIKSVVLGNEKYKGDALLQKKFGLVKKSAVGKHPKSGTG